MVVELSCEGHACAASNGCDVAMDGDGVGEGLGWCGYRVGRQRGWWWWCRRLIRFS